jgi:hypothetical protein
MRFYIVNSCKSRRIKSKTYSLEIIKHRPTLHNSVIASHQSDSLPVRDFDICLHDHTVIPAPTRYLKAFAHYDTYCFSVNTRRLDIFTRRNKVICFKSQTLTTGADINKGDCINLIEINRFQSRDVRCGGAGWALRHWSGVCRVSTSGGNDGIDETA